MHIYLDIETIPAQDPAVRAEIEASMEPPGNISKPETIAAWHAEKKPDLVEQAWRRTALDGSRGHVAVIGYAVDDSAPTTFYREDWQAADAERDVLGRFFSDLAVAYQPNAGVTRPVFVGHNVTGFDLRFLFQRAVILGVRPPMFVPFHAKPWDEGVFDTMTQFAGIKNTISADRLSRALGMEGKGDMDGSKVWEAVREGRIADVAAYCGRDVEAARAFHRRLTFAEAA